MGRASYSSVQTFWDCPFHYKLRYIDRLETKPDTNPSSALYEGTAIHEAIEKRSITEGLNSYKSNYPVLGKEHEFEMYKLEKTMEKAIQQVPHGEYEFKLLNDYFVGYVDMLVKVSDDVYDLYDFKYSQNVDNYMKSGQIHIYKYFYEKITGNTIRDIYYCFIPKSNIKYSEEEDIDSLKKKFDEFIESHDVEIKKVEYNPVNINYFFARQKMIEKTTVFEKHHNFKCMFCEYQKFCRSNGKDKSELVLKEDGEGVEEVTLWS